MEPTQTAAHTTGMPLKSRFLEILREQGGKTVDDLARATGTTRDGARKTLNTAEKEGLVKRDGTYRAPGRAGRASTLWRLSNSTMSAEERKQAMAAGAHRIGDHVGAVERNAAGRRRVEEEQARESEAMKVLDVLAADAVSRAEDHGAVGELQFIQRIKAVTAAKRAADWPATEHALIDVAACALGWAARINHAEGADERLAGVGS